MSNLKPYNPEHEGAFNEEIAPDFEELTDDQRKEADDRLKSLIRRARKDLED